MILAGAAADHYSPAWVIAVSGTVGAAVALAITVSWAGHRMQSTDGHLQRLGVSPSGCRAWRLLLSCVGWRVGAGLRSAPVDVAHGVLLLSWIEGRWGAGWGFSPSGCRAWRPLQSCVGWLARCRCGSAPVDVAHGLLLPFSVWLDSLRNHVNAPAGDAVRPRALAGQGAPLRCSASRCGRHGYPLWLAIASRGCFALIAGNKALLV